MKTTINIILLVICSSVFSQLTFDEKNKIAQEIFDSFDEMTFKSIAKSRDQESREARPDYVSSGDDNVILTGIQGSDTSLGWVGFAFAANAADVKLLEMDGGDGCVAPTPATIASGEYPLSRPLFIYVNPAKLADNPALEAYVDFFMTEVSLQDAVTEVGYVPLAADEMAATQNTWSPRSVSAAESVEERLVRRLESVAVAELNELKTSPTQPPSPLPLHAHDVVVPVATASASIHTSDFATQVVLN